MVGFLDLQKITVEVLGCQKMALDKLNGTFYNSLVECSQINIIGSYIVKC